MENKEYNSKLRALLSIRNFSKILERHYEQMLQIENNLDELNKNALSIIEAHCSPENQEKWKNILKGINNSISSINQVLKSAKEKVVKKDRSGSSELWKQFNINLEMLKGGYRTMEKVGFEILPKSEHDHWKKDICNFEATILPLIIVHAEACRVELEMIEMYTPKELDNVTQIVLDHIPEDFTFEESDKYEKDYIKALEELKKEFSQKKNLWDKFLDILAGGTHQPPSERVMLQRWIDGEKQDL